jgi:hypothetical protein
MKLRLALAVTLLAATAGGALAAPRVGEDQLRRASIQLDAATFEGGQTVEQFIDCLRHWNPGDGRPLNDVQVARLSDDVFTVTAVLRSRSIFHFQVAPDRAKPIAMLRRVEYAVATRAAYQQITDPETKRVMLRSVCTKP